MISINFVERCNAMKMLVKIPLSYNMFKFNSYFDLKIFPQPPAPPRSRDTQSTIRTRNNIRTVTSGNLKYNYNYSNYLLELQK